ncbi:MAG: hypothetical protein R3C49_00830 [Planctomycetaceae bacterium]
MTDSSGTFSVSFPLAPGQWTWWVGKIGPDAPTAAWSNPAIFRVDGGTQLTAPPSVVSTQTPEFRWAAVTDADHYQLQVDQVTSTGSSISTVIRENHLTDTTYQPPQSLEPGHYRAWVQAISLRGTPGAWSSAIDFEIL